MIGSYNFTNAARLQHIEHGVLREKDFDSSGLRSELQNLWQSAPEPVVKIARVPIPAKFLSPPEDGGYNPYKKPKTK